MDFGDDHYTRDWDLLKKIAEEGEIIRKAHNLGSKATQEQIEAVWDKIFSEEKSVYPNLMKLFPLLCQDEVLKRHLKKCWNNLQPWQRKGYCFKEILGAVLSRIFLSIVRNAHKWHSFRKTLVHWARFWSDNGLRGQLLRTIKALEKNEGILGVQPHAPPEARGPGFLIDPETDYLGRRSERPEKSLEEAEEQEKMLREIRRYVSETEAKLVEEWMKDIRVLTPEEIQKIRSILRRIKHHKR